MGGFTVKFGRGGGVVFYVFFLLLFFCKCIGMLSVFLWMDGFVSGWACRRVDRLVGVQVGMCRLVGLLSSFL